MSLPNRNGPDFDYSTHKERISAWQPQSYPNVDIYLPICGEPVTILHNTWTHVYDLIDAYPGWAQAYVLDDGADEEARAMAADFGFTYHVRADRPYMKKAGNLRDAFTQTQGEYMLLLDADFAPRPDFLAEILPYFDDPQTAIVQTPQYFRTSPQQTWIERSAGAVQEMFYRFIQVSRDYYDASICVGSCAVYRRTALADIGGMSLNEHSEDIHTGFDLRLAGWKMRYIPVALAAGACPADPESFLTQQYRWCDGSMSFLGARKFWAAKMSALGRCCYISGFCYYVYTAVEMLFSPLIPTLLLIKIPLNIEASGYISLIPGMISGMVLYPLWHRSNYGPATWSVVIIRSWAHTLALWDILRGRHMGWQVTGSTGRKSQMRRFWIGVTVWNGSAALAWLLIAAWRISQYGLGRYWIIAGFGLLYAFTITRVLISYDHK